MYNGRQLCAIIIFLFFPQLPLGQCICNRQFSVLGKTRYITLEMDFCAVSQSSPAVQTTVVLAQIFFTCVFLLEFSYFFFVRHTFLLKTRHRQNESLSVVVGEGLEKKNNIKNQYHECGHISTSLILEVAFFF